MEPFKTFRGIIAVLDRANVDTDQIIPKQFLKSIKRTGFGRNLFFDWRYLPDGKVNLEFPLNSERFKDASILVARNNFGCGSSREHAVWAIQQGGFKAVIAPRAERNGKYVPAFADIFRNNCIKNSLLPIELNEQEVDDIFQEVHQNTGLEAVVDLAHQQVTLCLSKKKSFHFDIGQAVKDRLLHGIDDISTTFAQEEIIRSFEKKHDSQLYQ